MLTYEQIYDTMIQNAHYGIVGGRWTVDRCKRYAILRLLAQLNETEDDKKVIEYANFVFNMKVCGILKNLTMMRNCLGNVLYYQYEELLSKACIDYAETRRICEGELMYEV